ncbi:hypothetical protein MHU86_22878 [Fragilaria crotonensis]|nr:hypothetical protein MHU86_22878 [Fragilaria crotonensis]
MASEATMKSSPLETIKVIPFGEMTRRRAVWNRESSSRRQKCLLRPKALRGACWKVEAAKPRGCGVDKRGRTSAEVEQRCSQFFYVMPGRRICDYRGRRDGERHVESVEKSLRFEEDERPCEGNYAIRKVLHEE